MNKLNTLKTLAFLLVVVLISSCTKEETTAEKFKKAADNYVDIVVASYDDSYTEAKKLRDNIYAFVDAPTAAGLEQCKQQWLAARVPYGQTEVYRFYGGPIDNENDGPEGLINAWPMDESFIDYVDGNQGSGLINDATTYPTISKEKLVELNESISEESIFTGYHAIEFLLWGQDLSTSGPGTRPYTDYVTGAGGTAANQARRGQYLKTVADLLLENLTQVIDQWKPGATYRTSFLAQSKNEIIEDVFTALGELSKGELSGERMFVAVDSKDQENEHSCFSDNTHVDILENFNGLANVYNGTYKRTSGSTITGKSYAELARDLDETKAKAVETAISNARTKINAIPTPFDQAILNNGPKVLEAVTALEELSDRFAAVKVVLDAAK